MTDQKSALTGPFEYSGAIADLPAALARSEERFRAIVAGAPDPVALIADGRFTLLNQRLVDLLGFGTPGVLRHSLVLQRVHPDDRSCFAETIQFLLEGPPEATLAPQGLRLIAADGREVHVSVTVVRVDGETGPALFVTLRDLTEHRKLHARLARSDRMASLGTLATGIAHEINNPLGFVLMNLEGVLEELPELTKSLEVLRSAVVERIGEAEAEDLFATSGLPTNDQPFEDLTERTRDAYFGAQRVRDIVRDLKTFANVETGEAPLGPVQVESALEVALNLACHDIKYKACIRRELSRTPLAHADEGRLSQVLLNLLVNAAQAPEGVDPKQVLLRSYQQGNRVCLEVCDNGAGISASALGQVFEPFFTTKAAGEGSGMGLAISREIVRGFGGDMEVESTPGQGATFRVILPIAEQPTAVLAEDDDPTEEHLPLHRPRILVVDDEPMMLRAIERRLTRDYEVTCAVTGSQALERLSEEANWDMVLCDLVMPGVDGAAVYRWIQTHRPQLLERTVLMTGGAVTSESRCLLDETDNVVLSKPLQVPQLLRVLRGMVSASSQCNGTVLRS